MARLSNEHKRVIVERLATFVAPSAIVRELQELGVQVSLSQIAYYNPESSGTSLAQEWRDLFVTVRGKFTTETANIAISHRTFRLREIGKLYQKVTANARTPNVPLALECLIEAEKITGDMYVNARANAPGTMTDEERAQRIRASLDAMDDTVPRANEHQPPALSILRDQVA